MESFIKIEDKIPEFTLGGHDGTPRSVPSDMPVVLVFFRGQWCPYCRWELSGLQTINSAVGDAGAKLIAVSPDSASENEDLRRRLGLTFAILSDADLSVTDSFGLRHVGGRPSTGQDMPFPTTFLVHSDGTVPAKFENETYQDRPAPKHVLAAVKRLLSQQPS